MNNEKLQSCVVDIKEYCELDCTEAQTNENIEQFKKASATMVDDNCEMCHGWIRFKHGASEFCPICGIILPF